MEIISIILLVLFWISGNCQALSSTIKVCPRSDPDINECIKGVVNEMKSGLAKGKVFEQYSIASVEPLTVPVINLKRGAEFEADFINVIVSGASNFEIQSISANLRDLTFELKLLFPYITFHGTYKTKLMYYLAVLLGPAEVSGIFENSTGHVILYNELYEKNGKIYMRVKQIFVKTRIGSGSFKLTNLIQGIPMLDESVNLILNTHSRFFFDQLSPSLDQSIARAIQTISNEILQIATFDEFFPEEPNNVEELRHMEPQQTNPTSFVIWFGNC